MSERRGLVERLPEAWIAAVAGVRVVVWLAAGAPTSPAFSRAALLIIVSAFTTASLLLVWGSRGREPRARPLALAYLLVATTYTDWGDAAAPRPPDWLATALHALQPSAFLPYAVWTFCAAFPQAPLFPIQVRRLERVRLAMYGLGLLLFLLGLVPPALLTGAGAPPAAALIGLVHWSHPARGMWVVLGLCTLPALVVSALRTKRAREDERRRVSVFLAGIIVGAVPPLLQPALLALVPALSERRHDPTATLFIYTIEYGGLFIVLAASGYAILARRALDVRFIVRRTLQYALARNVLLAVTTLPFVVLVLLAYRNRARPVGELFADTELALLVGLTATGVALSRFRIHARAFIDRMFFREQYDARRILAALVDKARTAPDSVTLARLCSEEIDRALHVERIALLYATPGQSALVSPAHVVRPLPVDAALLERLRSHAEPLDVDWDPPSAIAHDLSLEDRHWLVDAGFRLLLPLRVADQHVIGILGLGEKRSELPYSSEDKDLLIAIAGAAALALENRLLRDELPPASRTEAAVAVETARPLAEPVGRVCAQCGIVQEDRGAGCGHCGDAFDAGEFPLVLAGKYQLLERIGRGGMGIVFRARDRTLGRDVAIKTLPLVNTERAARLRREARAMAALTHPNLATILAAEIWHGTPCLIVEYLAGGTLAERLETGALEESAAVRLGVTLAGALERLHGAGILHRDIKPANIGYTADGTPKLLDFGLARLIGLAQPVEAASEQRQEQPVAAGSGVAAPLPWSDAGSELTPTNALVGTMLYLSPEALDGALPDPSFDLWSLNVVLYECLSGHNPFAAGGQLAVMGRIIAAPVPDVRSYRSNVSSRFASYLDGSLSRDRRRRPQSAREMRERLERMVLRPV